MQAPKHDPNWVIIGRVGRTYGLHGKLVFHLFGDPLPDIDNYYIYSNKWSLAELSIEFSTKPKIKFTNYNSPEEAKIFTNKYIAVARNDLPQLCDNEFYWHDLIGMKVVNNNLEELGIVDSINNHGAQPNLVIKNEKIYLIPMIDQVVINKDFTNRIITVDWDLKNN